MQKKKPTVAGVAVVLLIGIALIAVTPFFWTSQRFILGVVLFIAGIIFIGFALWRGFTILTQK
ncbi:hypothetical protein HY009_05765 [Candidatus Acetothermia bacterium]|nr:hypothetical protein [Candidatus Acetothermia bacterium]